jgi:hypothetical protein
MPLWLVIALFLGIIAALGVIVHWEFKRARNAPSSMAVKRYLDSGGSSPLARVPKEAKRGFDGWK